MKTYPFIISVLLLAVFVFSFKIEKQNTDGAGSASAVIGSKAFHRPIVDKAFYASIKETVPIDTVYVAKDTLHILTKKISGCDAGVFKLVWNGALSKSAPPQTSVRLFKAADTDCGEKHKFNLIFNISPLRLKQDSIANSSTIVHIGGWREPVKYEFDSVPRKLHHKN